MGCGAVEIAQSNKHDLLSQNVLQELLPSMAIHPPLLLQQQYLQFSSSLRQNKNTYIILVEPKVSCEESVPRSILQKWRIVLYGLEKSDYVYRRCLGFEVRNENDLNKLSEESQNIANNPSYYQMKGITQYHSCFQQIEKDLNRTFSFQQHTQLAFEQVLKRIANHFPSMGYTQGVNFVVGYLLLQGYSETDTFWMFAHLAMNKRFLLLGLYEDGFPLAGIFTLLFKNILKRIDEQLFNHIYCSLLLDDSVWIFKWFITLFIYSFPLEIIKYVWDCLIQLGSIGLVYFSLALVTHLKTQILQCQDPCDISEFFQSLKNLEAFNNLVNIKTVVEQTYQMKLRKQDLQGVSHCRASFYQEYYKLLQNQMEIQSSGKLKPIKVITSKKMKQNSLTSRLHLWFVKLLEQRIEFTKKKEEDKIMKDEIPEELKESYQEMQKSVKILTDKVIQNESQKSIREMPAENSHDYFTELIMDDPIRTAQTQPPEEEHSLQQAQNINKIPTRISYNIGEQIDELDGESDSNNGEELQPSNEQIQSRIYHYSSPQDLSIQIDQNHPEELTPKINKMNLDESKNTLEYQRKKEGTKASNLKIDPPQIRSGFGLAGQNILGNISVTNSQYSSLQSKNTSYKPKKQKENIISRYNNSSKTKIEALSQLSHPSNELSSDHESSIDRRTQKDSISGFTQRDHVRPRQSFGKEELFISRKTQQEIMVISHGPEKRNAAEPQKDSASEIEIFHGQGLFKKKKRTYNRNSIITSITREMVQPLNLTDQITIEKGKHKTYNDEESLESVLQLSAVRKTKRPNLGNSPNVLFEIESINRL